MPDPLEILLSQRDPGDGMQRALASGLRRRREIAELAQLTGDEVLVPFGQNLGATVQRDATAERARLDKAAQRKLTSDYYEQQAANSRLSQAMAVRKQDEVERHNKAMEAKIYETAAKKQRDDVRKLATQIAKADLPFLQEGISNIDDELAPYIESGEGLPGIGYLSNVGPAFTSEGRQMQTRVAKIRNMILKARSGGAVTPQEASRLLEEFALGAMNSEDEFMLAWADFKDTIAASERNIYAGYPEEVKDEYLTNLSREAQGAPQGPSGAGTTNPVRESNWDQDE